MSEITQTQDKFLIRLPDGLRASIKKLAEDNGRSMNAEIVLRLMANDTETLRDRFAGQALANVFTHSENSPDKAAEWAYQIADAMIAAREGGAS